ncbi:hypothetical protein ACFL5M_01030 [Candidatus Neomarinimicrobiota bacterium]
MGIQLQWLGALPLNRSLQTLVDTPTWSIHTRIQLPRQLAGIGKVAAAAWSSNFYLLDELQLQIIAVSPRGEILYKYGGWGTGTLSLDLPVHLIAVENSVFVLDQGQRQILRLDAMLNPVAVAPLPDDRLPLSFCRDVQRRFWVIYENQAGIFVYDEAGGLIDIVADRTDGLAVILHPSLIASSHQGIAVWDSIEGTLYIFRLSGQFVGKRSLTDDQAPIAMVWVGGQLLLTTGDQLLVLPSLEAMITPVAGTSNLVDLTTRPPELIGLDPSGVLRVFRPLP